MMKPVEILVFVALIGFVLSSVLVAIVMLKVMNRLEETVDRLEVMSVHAAIDLSKASEQASRMEYATRIVAENLADSSIEKTVNRMELADRVVADDLAASVSRADATVGPDGAAADAALRTGDSAAAITERQDRET